MRRRGHAYAPPSLRLDVWRRRSLYALVAILAVSGALWLVAHGQSAEGSLPSPIEPWSMKWHGAAALLLIYLSGTMLYGHMLNAWRRRRNRVSGGAAAAVFFGLGLSGYGLYYFGGEDLRAATQWLHWGLGAAVVPLLFWHIARGRCTDTPPHGP